MSACCRGWAFDGVHDKACAVGRAASEAAPEHFGPPAVRPELTDAQKQAQKAKIDALILAAQIAARNARGEA